MTWRNELPAGETSAHGVRCGGSKPTGSATWPPSTASRTTLYGRAHARDEELEWLRRQGPVVPGLVEALRSERDRFHAVVFFTYLYYPTFFGLAAAPARSILVPTTHDEPALRLGIFREVFARPAPSPS